jgi:peptidoglycan hydrolase CwlO-like protein
MKKTIVLIAALIALAAPMTSFAAMDHTSMDDMDMNNAGEMQHASHGKMDAECTKECEMLLKNCAQDVSNIQDQIKVLQNEINKKGASTHTLQELKTLSGKLRDAKETLSDLQKPGK